MIRTLLTTTALVTILASGAIAQDAPATTDAPAADTQTVEVQVVETQATGAQATGNLLAQGYTWANEDNLASEMIGMSIYSSAADDADNIGDIDDLVIGQNGEVAAVIISVGGFLGIGEKRVAIDYDSLEYVIAADNTARFVATMTREDLEAAPEFQEREARAVGTAPMDQQQPTAPGAAPADQQPMAERAPGTFDPAGMDRIDPTTLTADELTGTDVYGHNNEHIGTVGDLVLGEDGSIDALIIDFGGFLGIGVKEVAVGYENLNFVADAGGNRSLVLPLTREQMDAAPDFDRDTYAAERDNQRIVLQ